MVSAQNPHKTSVAASNACYELVLYSGIVVSAHAMDRMGPNMVTQNKCSCKQCVLLYSGIVVSAQNKCSCKQCVLLYSGIVVSAQARDRMSPHALNETNFSVSDTCSRNLREVYKKIPISLKLALVDATVP